MQITSTAKVQLFSDMYKSTLKKKHIVRQIVALWYEEGRQDRSKEWVYRNKVRPALGISNRTFWRYLAMTDDLPEGGSRPVQLTLEWKE